MDNNITNSNIIKEKCFSPYTENTKSFDIILVKPNKIGDIDYNNIYYLNQILSLPIFEFINVNPEDLGNIITKYLNIDLNKTYDIVTELFWEEKTALYDIIYQDFSHLKKNNDDLNIKINEFANLLFDKNIYGNVLLFKSNIPIDSYSMIPESIILEDISHCLDSRITKKGVKLCEYSNKITEITFVESKLNEYIEEYFELDTPILKEIPFYKHNLNIYYTKAKESNNKYLDLTNLLGTYVNRVFFCSKHTEKIYTHLSKEEVDWIILISQNKEPEKHSKFDFSGYFCHEYELTDEKDNLNRDVIKNKYRILYQKYKNITSN